MCGIWILETFCVATSVSADLFMLQISTSTPPYQMVCVGRDWDLGELCCAGLWRSTEVMVMFYELLWHLNDAWLLPRAQTRAKNTFPTPLDHYSCLNAPLLSAVFLDAFDFLHLRQTSLVLILCFTSNYRHSFENPSAFSSEHLPLALYPLVGSKETLAGGSGFSGWTSGPY